MGKLVLHMGVRLVKKLILGVIIVVYGTLLSYAQDFIDEGTREIDRPVFKEIEKKLTAFLRKKRLRKAFRFF